MQILTLLEMSAFDSFVIWTRSRVWNLLLLLLLLLLLVLLRSTVAPTVLGLVVLVLAQSVHPVVPVVLVLITSIITVVITPVVLEVASATSHVVAPSTELTTVSSEVAAHVLWLATSAVVLLLWLTRCLITVLVLDAFLSQNELLRSELFAGFSQLFVTMCKVAFLLEEAVFVGLVVSASLGLVLLVELLPLFLGRGGESLVHSHLVVHHVLLLELALAVVAHHAHHGLVVEHLLGHLTVLVLHLLHVHAHVVHIGWHLRHLVGLHLVCSVHIEFK